MTKPLQQFIIKTSALTLFFVFTAFSYGLAVFGFIFPGVMADLGNSLGAPNMAGMYYERIYNANKTPENAYYALDRYITAQNHGKVIKFGEMFLEQENHVGIYLDDYERIIRAVNTAGCAAAGNNKLNLLKWGNEDNRIKCAYTVALLESHEIGKAELCLSQWLSTIDLTQPNHAFFAFVIAGKETASDVTNFSAYVNRFTEKFEHGHPTETIFALNFLMIAHSYLGNTELAGQYAESFYGLV
jgi:hypothetical protein